MRSSQEMLDTHRDNPVVRAIDWESDGMLTVAEKILALEGIHDPTLEQLETLTDLLLDEAGRGLWIIEDPDLERRLQVGARAIALLNEDREEGPPTVH